ELPGCGGARPSRHTHSLSLALPLFLVESGEVVFLFCCVAPHTPAGECTGIPKLRRLLCVSAVPSQAGTVAPTPIQSSRTMELIVLPGALQPRPKLGCAGFTRRP
ncbi:unnamed protein product, partial [Ectocarpus sp. 12 AP-2014]